MKGRRFKNVREWTKALDVEDRSKLVGLSPGGAAGKIGIARQHVYRLIHQYKLDTVKISRGQGRQDIVYITEESIDRFIRERGQRLKETS